MPSRSDPLASWDATRQQTYRTQHPDRTFLFHLLLDASGSMYAHEAALRNAYNLYLRWLQRHAPAMSLVDTRAFGSTLQPKHVHPLSSAHPLTSATYAAELGGTALFDALGTVLTQATEPGQHLLIVLTDGMDGNSSHWTAHQVHELLTTLHAENDWLCVFLGAFPEALAVGTALGFTPGNCLVFGSEHIPEAFAHLTTATAVYLQASPAARKLLAQSGIFHEGVSL